MNKLYTTIRLLRYIRKSAENLQFVRNQSVSRAEPLHSGQEKIIWRDAGVIVTCFYQPP